MTIWFSQLQTMLKSNETLPDIERLNRHEFDLDIEEQLRLQAEADQEVERVGIETHLVVLVPFTFNSLFSVTNEYTENF